MKAGLLSQVRYAVQINSDKLKKHKAKELKNFNAKCFYCSFNDCVYEVERCPLLKDATYGR
jgi:hypothetical protein